MTSTQPAQSPSNLARRLLPLLDLTRLGEDDSPAQIARLCASARGPQGATAAVCVYPEHVQAARAALQGSPVRVATVVNFPDGGEDSGRALRELRRAVAVGAQEIDLVLPWRALKRGDADAAASMVADCRRACGATVVLKLILETGALGSPELIRAACAIGLDAGVDFLKTSTGKAEVNATPQAAAIMLDMIAARGGRCGFKAAGGVRTLASAATYLALAEARFGAGWPTAERFRIGASALHDELLAVLASAP